VPTKVTNENGEIQPGDLLTTSSTEGHAMKCEIKDVRTASDFDELKEINYQNDLCRNSILGKALEPCTQSVCKITALVTLQ
ncbi:hypothetical protein CMO89_02070, partial [Candidatus Woesearchaeota archaeon]|nr:hypothetical protein [Candidatus Woesearchaeota archaeon]